MTPVETDQKPFGRRLAAARNAAGLTGEAVGAHLGYKSTRKAVSAWESGGAVPDAMVLR
jgi:transcriptional regulator with XRE-family HTH domain